MNNKSSSWKEIEEWINLMPRSSSLSSLVYKFQLDKESCKKIMDGCLLGHDSDEIYDIRDIPDFLKCDTEIGVKAIKLNRNNFHEIPKELQSSIEFHKLLLQNYFYPWIFERSPSSIRGNEDFVKSIISDYPIIYSSLTEELRSDKNLLMNVLENKFIPKNIPKIFANQKIIIVKIINSIQHCEREQGFNIKDWLLSFISNELLSDRDVLIALFSNLKWVNVKIPKKLKEDIELIIKAVESNPHIYESLDNDLKANHNVALAVFKTDFKFLLKYLDSCNSNYFTVLEYIKTLDEPHHLCGLDDYDTEFFEEMVESLIKNRLFIDEIAFHLASVWPIPFLKFNKYFVNLDTTLQKNKVIIKTLLHEAQMNEKMYESDESKDLVSVKFVYENYIKPYYPNDNDYFQL